jgi:predicted  nucleic acid-binding Zn-ribbon protein
LTIPEQIKTLEELAALDAELKAMDEELLGERSTLTTLKGTLKTLEGKLAETRMQLEANDKNRNEFIGDVRTMMQQLEHSRDKLNRSRTEREANAAQRELEELRKLVRDREDEIGRLGTEGDALRLSIEGTEAEIKKVEGELGSNEGAITQKLASVEGNRASKQKEREEVAKKLPPVLYRRYETVRARRGVGIAQTSDGTCKACNMSLPPQLYHRLRREPLLEQCPSCQRIIYFIPPTPTQQAER